MEIGYLINNQNGNWLFIMEIGYLINNQNGNWLFIE